ncbi:hypothetical protein ACQCVK_22410 [Rossellomorea vietnamensis]|uniref:hypothetical protein n=1 Tax=Rossellomorea vietnamensis TaxID=218284 RepID=UPI003CF66C5D
MTYYYLASDQKLGSGNGTIGMAMSALELVSGFDYPIQVENINGLEKEWELQALLQYIQNHTAPYKICPVQVANLLNSNRVELKVRSKSKVLLHEIAEPEQLLLEEGHLLIIKKVPRFT